MPGIGEARTGHVKAIAMTVACALSATAELAVLRRTRAATTSRTRFRGVADDGATVSATPAVVTRAVCECHARSPDRYGTACRGRRHQRSAVTCRQHPAHCVAFRYV